MNTNVYLKGFDGNNHVIIPKGASLPVQHEFYVQSTGNDMRFDIITDEVESIPFTIPNTKQEELYSVLLTVEQPGKMKITVKDSKGNHFYESTIDL